MTKVLALAACLSCLTMFASSAEAGGQRRGGHGGGRAQGGTRSPRSGGQRRGGTAAPAGVPSGSATAPDRFTSTLLFAPPLPSRPIAPFAGTLPRGRVGRLFSPFWWPGLDTDYQADETPAFPVPSPPLPPSPPTASTHAEPSSIQWRGPVVAPPQPAGVAAGILQFDVEPRTALVYMDGFSVGSVDNVNARGGLTLAAGWHRLEFRAPGYQTPAVNVTVEAFRTITQRLVLKLNQ